MIGMTEPYEPNADLAVGADTLACPACGYDLRGQAEPRCPECGTDYGSWEDVRKRSRDRYAPVDAFLRFARMLLAAQGCTLAIIAIAAGAHYFVVESLAIAFIAAVASLCLLVVSGVSVFTSIEGVWRWWCLRRPGRPRLPEAHRRMRSVVLYTLALLALPALSFVAFFLSIPELH
jgi:hypothetical protein